MITYEAKTLEAVINDGFQRLEARLSAVEATGYNAAVTLDQVADQTTPVIGWGFATLIGIGINVIALPIAVNNNIPYITPAAQKLVEIEKIIIQEIGISVTTVTDIATGEGQGVHPQLMAIYRRANELANQQGFNIHIRDGLRTAAEQAANVRNGASKTMNSRHIKAANGWGHALDLEVLYEGPQSNEKDWEGVNKIAPLMKQAAAELNIPLEWGGDWKNFRDGFHFQLPWETHNGKTAYANAPVEQLPVIDERNISALLTEIKRTESSGGNYRIESAGSCMLGAYQAAAITLTELGYMYRDKFDNAGKPEKGQAHCDFLANPNNWTIKGGKATFLASSALQDEFARKNIQHNLKRGTREGAITASSSQAALTGYSKAAWLKPASAIDYYKTGTDDTDGNGTAISRYASEGQAAAQVTAATGNVYTLFTRLKGALLP